MRIKDRQAGILPGLVLVVAMGLAPASIRAQSNYTVVDSLPLRAQSLEQAGKWNDALQLWCKVYSQDRQNDEAHKHIQTCLRRIFQTQRQTDKSLRERVLSLSHSQALALYSEVLTTLQAAYVDRAKVAPERLFQQGLDEFLLALNDANFRKLHMPGVRDREVQDFQKRLKEFMVLRTVDSVPDAVQLVRQIATTARRDLQIAQTSVIVLEFIGGACNSLDEYTSYLSPADLMAEAEMAMTASVVDAAPLKDGIGYLRITHFRDTTPEELDSAIAALKLEMPQGLRALVMDLRGNTGGLFSSAVQVVERFVPAGVIASTQGQLDEFNKVISTNVRMNNVLDVPLIVLVDARTASAAEVLAGAFRDHQRATLVGVATYGKGSIQRVLQFQTAEEVDDSGKPRPRTGGIRITLARFFSPNGQAINGAGVSPHVVEQDKSRHIEIALEQASRYVSAMPPR